MMTDSSNRKLIAFGLASALVGGAAGAAGALAVQLRGGQAIHDYIVSHPEVLPEAMDNLRRQEDSQALAGVRSLVDKPFPGAVLGNPQGSEVLVEFSDYACGFCRKSIADVEELIAARPQLKVVMRELPILTPESTDAARMALAAAAQGRYAAFHDAMFAQGHPSAETIAEAAREAHLDMARAKQALADPAIQAELDRNLDFARQLGFSGTPAWVAGGQLLSGAVGLDKLAAAIDGARH